jgi:protein-glutamine gamma-glutamyltransferase
MPPLLLGAAALFWGWQTGVVPVGIAMALTLEARGLVRWRWDLARADFNRVSDACTVLLVLIGVYQAVTSEAARAVTALIQWLPLVVFPLVVCQLYGVTGRIEVAVFFWSQRNRPGPAPRVDLTPAYFALCLLSASIANATATFYAGLVALSAWALWHARGRTGPLRWGLAIALAAGLGWAGHVGLAEAQRIIERRAQALYMAWMRREPDPHRTATSLGELGELKLSDRIVMRLEPGPGIRAPMLLREASYNVYHAPVWLAADHGFVTVLPEPDGATWLLRRGVSTDAWLTMSAYLWRGRGLLALPNGATRLEDLMVVSIGRNRLGAVWVEEGLGLVTYTAHFPRQGAAEHPPSAGDLRVPPRETAVVTRVASELDLAGRTPAAAVTVLRAHFDRFRYSRYLTGVRPGRTALEEFLTTTQAGHCEYFATATTLLLRAAGVPARYAVGYAAHEWSRVEGRWVVRARDAHAWTQAWIDGAWVDVDLTPAIWIAEETGSDSVWRPVRDLWAWATFLVSRWRWSERQDRLADNLGWLLIPLVAVLAWRLWARRRVTTTTVADPQGTATPRPGGDSEFYRVEWRLRELGFERQPAEPLSRWLDDVTTTAPVGVATGSLRPLLELHYRHRFDPAGLDVAERQRLRQEVDGWLAAHPPGPASAPAAAP